jgi:Uma2 family endonuclease
MSVVPRSQFVLGPEFDGFVDDYNERLHGDSRHQDAMIRLYGHLSSYRRLQGFPWYVGNQMVLLVDPRRNPLSYALQPDILIHPAAISPRAEEIDVSTDGPPTLVIQLASPATALAHDQTTLAPDGERGVYEAIGVPEYLVCDLSGTLLPEYIRAWRLGSDGHYDTWEPESDGLWVSARLGIAFAPKRELLAVYDTRRRRVWKWLEPDEEEEIGTLKSVVAEQRCRIAELEAELRRLRGEG